MLVLDMNGIDPNGPLGPRELDGLPLPEQVWDDQVALDISRQPAAESSL